MRERSHAKGRSYQRDVRRWLTRVPLFGGKARSLGDAYDVTASSAVIGGKQFDFSLALHAQEDEEARTIVFVECKYRSGRSASTASAFDEFARDVLAACRSATQDRLANARFLFVATTPPRSWSDFIARPIDHLRTLAPAGERLGGLDELSQIAQAIEVLVLRPGLLGGNY